MKAETITQFEEIPAAYPVAPDGLSEKAGALNAAIIWQRIEAYIAHRFTARQVTWLVEGKGHWGFPLAPATLENAEKWDGEAWVAVTLAQGPYGYCLDDAGPYRIVGDVGGGEVPEALQEAYKRLAEYLASGQADNILLGRPGVSSHTGKVGDLEESYDRNPAWLARAMQYSGAADLLRNYRRA